MGALGKKFSELEHLGGAAFNEIGRGLSDVLLGAKSVGDALRDIVAQLADMAINMAFQALGGSIGIPGYATGTRSAARGLALVGEDGPELVAFGGGERVYNNSDTRGMLSSSRGGTSINVNVNAPMSAREARESGTQIARRIRRDLNGPLAA